MLGGIGGELVQQHADHLRGRGGNPQFRPLDDGMAMSVAERLEAIGGEFSQLGPVPPVLRNLGVHARQRPDAASTAAMNSGRVSARVRRRIACATASTFLARWSAPPSAA